jgi:hypothetical protein
MLAVLALLMEYSVDVGKDGVFVILLLGGQGFGAFVVACLLTSKPDFAFSLLYLLVVVGLVFEFLELDGLFSEDLVSVELPFCLLVVCRGLEASCGMGRGSGRNRVWDFGGGGKGLDFRVGLDGWSCATVVVCTGGSSFLGGQKGLFGWNFFFGISGSPTSEVLFSEPGMLESSL